MTPLLTRPLRTDPSEAAVAGFELLLRHTAYVLLGFPLAIIAFVLVLTGLSVGVGLVVAFVGLPILVLTLYLAQGFATVERAQLASLLAADPEPPVYRTPDPDARPIRRLTTPLRDVQRWFDVVHALVVFPVAVVAFVMVITWWSVAISGSTFVLWGWLLPSGPDSRDLPELLGLGDSYAIRAVFYTAVGLVAAATLPFGVGAVARIRGLLGEVLLVGLSRQQRQIDDLVAGRAAARSAEESARRRLERDIHDGPQQRLVRLSMDLGRAQLKAGDAPPEVREALDDAKRQTQATLDELRALSRGIAPPVLADRGLRSAVEELAVRSPVPTRCDLGIDDARLDPHVESTAYFVVAEAMTNVAKHSGAAEATIQLELDGPVLRVTVHDDGAGGAAVAKGHGLAGLQDRVRAAEGTLTVLSPAGGPTVVMAEIPVGV